MYIFLSDRQEPSLRFSCEVKEVESRIQLHNLLHNNNIHSPPDFGVQPCMKLSER